MLSLASLDVTDTGRYAAHGYPWEEWDLLRREAPVYWYDRADYAPFWAVTRYADVVSVSRRSDVFQNGGGRLRLATRDEDAAMERGLRLRAETLTWDPDEPLDMVFMDGPRHAAFRLLTARFFTPGALRERTPAIAAHARLFADQLSASLDAACGGPVDFVRELAVKLPLTVICEMMGHPAADWRRLLLYTNALLGGIDPDLALPGETPEQTRWRAIREFHEFFDAAIARNRACGAGAGDLTNELVHARCQGRPLTDQQLHGYLLLLTAAGNETTRNATSGGLIALLEHPEQRDRLCAHPELLDCAVEEILRWTSPVIQFVRTAKRDYTIAGQKIRAGEHVALFYPSANRDERVFPEPYRFDVGRRPNHHLAFGFGAHFCLGANLARVELRATLEALLPLLPRLELAAPPTRVAHLHVSAINDLPVRWRE